MSFVANLLAQLLYYTDTSIDGKQWLLVVTIKQNTRRSSTGSLSLLKLNILFAFNFYDISEKTFSSLN